MTGPPPRAPPVASRAHPPTAAGPGNGSSAERTDEVAWLGSAGPPALAPSAVRAGTWQARYPASAMLACWVYRASLVAWSGPSVAARCPDCWTG